MAESLFDKSVKTNCLSDWLLFYSYLFIFITNMIYDVKNYIIVLSKRPTVIWIKEGEKRFHSHNYL